MIWKWGDIRDGLIILVALNIKPHTKIGGGVLCLAPSIRGRYVPE